MKEENECGGLRGEVVSQAYVLLTSHWQELTHRTVPRCQGSQEDNLDRYPEAKRKQCSRAELVLLNEEASLLCFDSLDPCKFSSSITLLRTEDNYASYNYSRDEREKHERTTERF